MESQKLHVRNMRRISMQLPDSISRLERAFDTSAIKDITIISVTEERCNAHLDYLRKEEIVFGLYPTLEDAINLRDSWIKWKGSLLRKTLNIGPTNKKIRAKIKSYHEYIEKNFPKY